MRPPTRLLRLLVLAGAGAAAASALSGCDASPYAATVNGQELTQTEFNSQLRLWSGNPTLAQLAAGPSNGQTTASLRGAGTATYSMTFTTSLLDRLVQDRLLAQAAAGHPPDEAALVIARALLADPQVGGVQGWPNIPVSVRNEITTSTADRAMLGYPQATDAQAFEVVSLVKPYFFDNLCVTEASAADQTAAQSIVTGASPLTGVKVCYDQQAFEAQPAAFQLAVTSLSGPGQIAQPVPTAYGYEVIQLASRHAPDLTGDARQVIGLAFSTQGSTTPQLVKALTTAKVKVNPMYGRWTITSTSSSTNFGITPPAGPPNP